MKNDTYNSELPAIFSWNSKSKENVVVKYQRQLYGFSRTCKSEINSLQGSGSF